MRNGVGEKADAGFVPGARAGDGSKFRSPNGGQCVIRQFNDVEASGFGPAKLVGEEVELLGCCFAEFGERGLMGRGEVNLDIGSAAADRTRLDEAAGDQGAGESRLSPTEVILIARFSVRRSRLHGALAAAGQDTKSLWNLDVQFGGEAVGEVAGHGKPARWIKEVGDGFLDGGELEPFFRTVFIAGNGALVGECPAGGVAFDEGRGGGDADGSVGGAVAGEQLACFVGDFGELERWVKTEVDDIGILRRGESDDCGGLDVVSGWVELGVNHVALNGEAARRTRGLSNERHGQGCEQQSAQCDNWSQ